MVRLETAARSSGWQGLAYDNGNSTLALRTLGEAYDILGNRDEAVRAYEEFVARWEHADANLQPQVDDVKARIALLRAGSGTDRGERLTRAELGDVLGTKAR